MLVGAGGVLLDADDLEADLAFFDGEGQADVAHADDADDGGAVLDLVEEILNARLHLGFRVFGDDAQMRAL